MGLYIQLIVVFAIIISRAELFASKNKLIPSAVDGIGMGLGFLGALVLVGAVRELAGRGTLLGLEIFGTKPLLIMILPTGGFFVIGLLMGLFNWIEYRRTGGSPPGSGGGHGGH